MKISNKFFFGALIAASIALVGCNQDAAGDADMIKVSGANASIEEYNASEDGIENKRGFKTIKGTKWKQGIYKITFENPEDSGDSVMGLIFDEYEKVALPDGAVAVDKNELNSLEDEVKKLKSFKETYASKHEKLKQEYFALQNKVKLDVANTELEGLNKQLSLLDSSIEEENARVQADVAQYEEEKAQFEEKKAQFDADKAALLAELNVESFDALKAKEEQPAPKAEPKPKVEKVLVPTYDEVLAMAKAVQGEEIECNVNPNGTMHKFTSAGKAFLILQKTSSDYRVTFSVLEEDIMENLRKYPGVVEVAKTPKTGNFLRLINKSEFDVETLKGFVAASLDCVKDAERRVQEAKEADKQAKLEAKEQEKRNKELLKEAEKIVAKAKKEEEKALKEAEKAAAKENNAPSEEEAA